SLVITDPVGKRALTGLSMGERTGSRVLKWVWSYVIGTVLREAYIRNQIIARHSRDDRHTSAGLLPKRTHL
ncbi:hypothetical protein LZ31DRAFT_481239, partial [Colletotrichum somersetense]